MQGILDLPGFTDIRRKRPPRTYFCLLPDAATATIVEALRSRLLTDQGPGWICMGWDRIHLSLQPVAKVYRPRPAILYAAIEAARRVVMPPFELCCREVVGFSPLSRNPDRCPLVLRADSLAVQDLHRRLGAIMARWGLRAAPTIAPHLTLARGPKVLPPCAVDPIRFAVHDFALVRSGAEYDVIERFPLCG